MMLRLIRAVAVALACAALAPPTAAAAQRDRVEYRMAGTDSVAVFSFLHRLQAAVRADDAAGAARLFHYPAEVWNGRCYLHVRTPAALVGAYPRVFPPELKRRVLRWGRDDLMSVGDLAFDDGRIWFGADEGSRRLGIWTVNAPMSMGDRPACPLPGARPASLTGTYTSFHGRDAGCTVQVLELPGARLRFALDCNRGAPSYNMGSAEGTVPVRGSVAIYRDHTVGPCEIRFRFVGELLEVTQTESGAGCGFGHGVGAGGVYDRISRARPKFESLH